jgi:hypothetical protein
LFTEILTAASREPVEQIEVQAHCTESKGNISTKMVEITSKSVGLIIGYLTSGTGFKRSPEKINDSVLVPLETGWTRYSENFYCSDIALSTFKSKTEHIQHVTKLV